MAETREAETAGITVSSSACKNYFGFLSQRPRGTPIPEECLTCERMLDCMVSKPDVAVAKLETKPELNVAEQVGTTVTVEEVTGTETSKELNAEPEKKIEPSFKQQTPKPHEAEKSAVEKQDGMLNAQCSSTVLMNKETLQLMGKKGRITKRVSSILRRALVEAAHIAVQCDERMKAFCLRVAARRGNQKATVAVACKMLKKAWFMLTRRRQREAL